MKSTEKILERIRELVPELKELKFGCEIKLTCFNKEINEIVYKVSKDGDENTIVYPTSFINDFFREEDFEIIGLPVELNHLFKAIGNNKIGMDSLGSMIFVGTYENKGRVEIEYNLSLTVEQNLNENESLRNLISELIF